MSASISIFGALFRNILANLSFVCCGVCLIKLTSLLSSLLFVISTSFVVRDILKLISLSSLIIIVSRLLTGFISGNSSSTCGGGDGVLPILVNQSNPQLG